jgi:hypothetical protein
MSEVSEFIVLRHFNAYNQDGEVQRVNAHTIRAELPGACGLVRLCIEDGTQFTLPAEEFARLIGLPDSPQLISADELERRSQAVLDLFNS